MHHQDRDIDDLQSELISQLAAVKEMKDAELVEEALSQKFGATGRFPDGRLTEHDEGEIIFGVTHYKGKIVFNFGKPVASLGMSIQQARNLRAEIQRHIKAIRSGE